ncbi:transglutaminase family protein [Flavobacterium sp. LB2P84]|jgi:transglutaminase-like putative cysteine protease|uniref:transglutaminase-like domain-containing protein n=1 Tax=Flavobacterium yafengii TaxID=3041253 RepID=UPI0024A84DE7|nr:transglutaminase family protein [Flavobacterium yafengii]MDI6033569.1 transglutaminase family protein [Flavobacterium yafengii]
MKFKVFSELSYEVFSPTTFIFNIQAAKSACQTIISELLIVTPAIKFEEFTLKNSGTRFVKMEVGKGVFFTLIYEAEVEVSYTVYDEKVLLQSIPIINLEHEVLPYISPSRHCESDKLLEFATKKFGYLPNEYAKAKAIKEWIFNTVEYKTGVTNSSTSACDTLLDRVGVCKDFAHLGIALCRALDIPARYFTGYAYNLNPPDFHACFEAYIGGRWLFFDPTKLAVANGLVKIANGKDASEVAVASYFGDVNCTFMKIECQPITADFTPFNSENDRIEAISYE